MRAASRSSVISMLAAFAVVVSAGILAGGLIAWTGLFSVAASQGHLAIVERILEFVMRNSVKTHATGIDAPPLDDDSLLQLGAAHFASGCAGCHSAPGLPPNPIAERMLPPPSDLATSVGRWTDGELFWIVRHGIKYTGMPGWAAVERGDEVWSAVAFLRAFPRLDAAAYRALAGLDSLPAAETGLGLPGRSSESIAAQAGCIACHGADGEMPRSNLVPMLHGQPAQMLMDALNAFATGTRRSGIMQPIAASLAPAARRSLAQAYADLSPPEHPAAPDMPARIADGRRLAEEGLPAKGIPPCIACHGPRALAAFPRLDGQHARYMVGRLMRWQDDLPRPNDGDAVMAPIARRMSAAQIADVAAYFASRRPGSPGRPQ